MVALLQPVFHRLDGCFFSALRESEAFLKLEAAQTELLAACRAQQWDSARQLAQKCRDLARPEWNLDAFYDLYEERIAGYKISPPGAEWTGVYVAESK